MVDNFHFSPQMVDNLISLKMEDYLNLLKMEDDLNLLNMEDDLNFFLKMEVTKKNAT